MATDLERLIVSLEASTTKYERALNKAMGVTNDRMRKIEVRAKAAGLNIGSALGRGLGLIGGGLALRGVQQLVDASTRIENSLKVAGLSGQELTRVYDRLFASAQRNAAPVESLVELYSRASLVQKELGVSTEELIGFTDKVALALRVSGKSAQESSGALLQLSQALGSGIVRAEEFNSLLEGALPVAQAAAAGLKEAGGSVAKLRQLVVDGKVSSEAFFRAFEAGSVILEQKVASAEFTVSARFVRLQNVLIDTAGEIDEATGLSEGLGAALNELARFVGDVGDAFRDNDEPIGNFFGALASGFATLEQWKKDFRANVGLSGPGGLDDFLEGTNLLKGQVGFASRQFPAQPTGPQGRGGRRGASPVDITVNGGTPGVTPVSLANYALSDQKATDVAKKHADAVKDLVSDLKFEGEQLARTAVEQEVMNNVRRAGVDAASAEGREIRALTEANFRHQQQIEAVASVYAELGEIGKSAVQDIISALSDMKITADEAGGILSNVLGMASQFFLNAAFGGANPLGALFGGGGLTPFSAGLGKVGFRAGGGSVTAGQPYIVGERRPELFVPNVSGTIVPQVPSASGRGGDMTFTFNISGGDRGLHDFVRFQLPGLIRKAVNDPHAVG